MPKLSSKRYRKSTSVADLLKPVEMQEAVNLLYKMDSVKFNETVELVANLGVDPRQSDQMVRGTVSLPHGSGKKVRVVVFTEKPQDALDAGADAAGLDDLIQKVQDGWMDFDVAISTTSAMKSVRNLARILGPRGLMPNPKSGTVSDDISTAVAAVKAGRVEFKMDKQGNVSIVVGKKSFQPTQVFENAKSALDALSKLRPDSIKGQFIKSLSISSTMSPSVRVSPDEYRKF